ncbi:MAG: ATP phosphoribosyltransferase regulatory subunit [Agarilytica sp.]
MSTTVDRWLLPDGIEELLPEQARLVERLRRSLIDHFETWGYDYVVPPMLEFTDSLLTGSGSDIDLLTFKVTDQLSGRMLGIRADITPQAARMDAHSLKREGVNRLCYAGHVLHAKPKFPLSSRTPLKVGVEMFGVQGVEAEIELISLLIDSLAVAEIEKQYIDIGHVGIFRSLAEAAGLDSAQEAKLFALMQSKSFSDISAWITGNMSDGPLSNALQALPKLSGDSRIIQKAKEQLTDVPAVVSLALEQLEKIATQIEARYPEAQLYFDLSELRGYHYHTGIVFGAFAPGVGNAIANGGRYDHVGEAFGRARSASGFDIDLSALSRLLEAKLGVAKAIFVVPQEDEAQWQQIQKLRAEGARVVMAMPGQYAPADYQNCDRQLIMQESQWQVTAL